MVQATFYKHVVPPPPPKKKEQVSFYVYDITPLVPPPSPNTATSL